MKVTLLALTLYLKKGLPWITDYSILRNKLYVLTNSASAENKSHEVKLWSVETGEVVKSYAQKTFAQVQKIISEELDLPATI